jgi:hypothetical protein
MFEKVCINEQSPSERECNEVGERNDWAAGGSHDQDHGHTYKKDKALCSPTSALEKKTNEC